MTNLLKWLPGSDNKRSPAFHMDPHGTKGNWDPLRLKKKLKLGEIMKD